MLTRASDASRPVTSLSRGHRAGKIRASRNRTPRLEPASADGRQRPAVEANGLAALYDVLRLAGGAGHDPGTVGNLKSGTMTSAYLAVAALVVVASCGDDDDWR